METPWLHRSTETPVTEHFFIAKVDGLGGVGEAGDTLVDLLEFALRSGLRIWPRALCPPVSQASLICWPKRSTTPQNEPIRLVPGLVGLRWGQPDVTGGGGLYLQEIAPNLEGERRTIRKDFIVVPPVHKLQPQAQGFHRFFDRFLDPRAQSCCSGSLSRSGVSSCQARPGFPEFHRLPLRRGFGRPPGFETVAFDEIQVCRYGLYEVGVLKQLNQVHLNTLVHAFQHQRELPKSERPVQEVYNLVGCPATTLLRAEASDWLRWLGPGRLSSLLRRQLESRTVP